MQDLIQSGLVSETDIEALNQIAAQYDIAITPVIANLIDKQNLKDPIAKQFVPTVEELNQSTHERVDPIGDYAHTKVKGLVHRYADRCLLKPVAVCPVYCRFCFRRNLIGAGSEAMSSSDLQAAYDYIAAHEEIWEVILTGGDPLILRPQNLSEIIRALVAIEHVAVIRIHTRIPVVSPERINQEMLQALKSHKALYVMLHANHANEFSSAARQACAKIVDAGIPMLSQSVLLKGVNDDVQTLKNLLRTLVSNRIKPYHLHHADLAKGTKHFRVSLTEGQSLVQELWGHLSGLCQPTYVLDIPDGYGKVPINASYVGESSEGHAVVRDYQGCEHVYTEEI